MSRTTLRPPQSEIDQINAAFSDFDMPPLARLRLRAVREWAKGKTLKEVAADPQNKCSAETVRMAVARYRQFGLACFVTPITKGCGRSAIDPAKATAVIEALRGSIDGNAPLSYRKLAEQHGVSIGKIAAIAKRSRLDPKHRRGPVAPVLEDTPPKSAVP